MYKVDPASGETEHMMDVLGAVTALASRTGLIVGTEGGEVYQLYEHRDTLMALWRRKVAGAVTDLALVDTTVAHGLAVADGAVFAVTLGGDGTSARAYALDPA